MPIKNGSNYMKEALKAIKAQNVDMEIIVIDDGSTDETSEIAKSFGCIVVKHEICKGLVISKNTGLKHAKGQYIMFHDHDEIMNENALPQMLQEIKQDDKTFAVMAKLKDFFSPELPPEDTKKVLIKSEPYCGLFSGAILMKKEVFNIVGFFDENLKAGDIIEWSGKMAKHNLQIKRLDLISVNRRIHNSNFGRTNKAKEYQDYASILRSKIKENKILK